MIESLSKVADILDQIADGKTDNIHALRAVENIRSLEPSHKLTARRWTTGVERWKDVSGLRRVACRLRELDPEYGVGIMIVKARYGVRLKNKTFVLDEKTNAPRIFTTKREAFLEFGPDADVQPMRCTFEVIVRAKQATKPKPKRK